MGRVIKFNRENAINWSMNEIWRKGFQHFSVKAVSEKLGITRSSFYHSFESREALFLEAFDRYFNDSPLSNLAMVSESTSPLHLLTNVFKETCFVRASDPEHRGCLVVNSVSELVGVNDILGPILKNAVCDSITCFEGLLNHSIRLGELPENTNTRNLALALQNLIMGLNTLSKVIQSEQELWATAETTLRALDLYRD